MTPIGILLLLLLVFGLACFLMSAFWTPEPPKPRLVALGLACWILAEILTRAGLH
jgi:cell division protein FtsW (lipid II flippase)